MQTLLIVSSDNQKAIEEAKTICRKNEIDIFDAALINFEKTVGIEDVRNFQKKLFLKPLKSKTKALILNIEESLTDEAQNALLKSLEEPPNNTIIILLVASMEILLPTVLSRCNIINLKSDLGVQPLSEGLNFILSIKDYGVGERLKFAQDNSKTKEDAKVFLENLILTVRNSLLKTPDNQKLKTLKSLNKTHKIISTTNANSRLVLENLFLSL